MDSKQRKSFKFLSVCLVLALAFAGLAYLVETDFGRVQVSLVQIPDPSGVTMTARLYRPDSATALDPKPAVLLLHGFQNDKDTESAFAIELARRGFVALALDQFGHGDTGNPAGGEDDTLGGNAAYQFLKSLDYVQGDRLGISGHSMGAGSTLATGAANPDHQALMPWSGVPGTPSLNNVLLVQARYEEFRGFRENQPRVETLTKNANRLKSLGLTGTAEWNTTYGSFADGSARRVALVNTVHPGVTHSSEAITESLLWSQQALMGGEAGAAWIDAGSHIYMWKEWLTLAALLVALAALLPLTELLLSLEFFKPVSQPMPTGYVATGWWSKALTNALVAGLTWPILAAVGAFAITAAVPSLRMIIANGIMAWYLGNILIYLVIFAFWYRKARKQGVTMYDLGVSFSREKMKIDWGIFGKTLLLGGLAVAAIYLVQLVSHALFGVEFRFLWPFMRPFTAQRLGYFFIYLIPAFLFFAINGGLFLFGQARLPEAGSERRTQLTWWLKSSFAGIFGLFLIWAFQYIPYLFLNQAPGFELIGLGMFGEMIPLLLFVYIPEFVILFYLLTWFFRRTGRVYLGAFVVACLVIWFLTAGTAIV